MEDDVLETFPAGSAGAAESKGVPSAAATTAAASPWLNAWFDPVASISAFSQCMRFVDLDGNGDSNFVVATLDQKLKVYRGTALVAEHKLLDTPVALCAFYTDMSTPRTPAIAVAAGSHVYVYRNLRPYFKFTVPSVEVAEAETTVWDAVKLGSVDGAKAHEALTTARDTGVQLTTRSRDLLALEEPAAREAFVATHRNSPLRQMTVITTMDTLCKSIEGDQTVSSIVVGTENKEVFVLNVAGSAIAVRCSLPSVPVFMTVSGTQDVEYRITVACRDNNVYTIKNGVVTGGIIELETQAVGLARVGKSLLVATMDKTVHSFHVKGKKNFSLYLPHAITCICGVSLKRARTTNGLLIGLANGDVRMYNEKSLVSTMNNGEPVAGIVYGSYGREDNTLALVYKAGALGFHMLKRSANLDVSDTPPGPPPEQDIPLNIPKKTKLYVEQTQRERDQATEMHRLFQRDLCKLRLNTARAYVKIITDGAGPMSTSSSSQLRLNAAVLGLGPQFKLVLLVQNNGPRALTDLTLTLNYNPSVYEVVAGLHKLPLLLPYKVEVPLRCVDEAGGSDAIKVFLGGPASCVPLISAIVAMPMSEVA